MTKFINRQNELKQLESEFNSKSATFTVIYGRRRVGKTALITEFLKDKPDVIYYLATEENELQNKIRFKGEVADYLNDDLLRKADLDWIEIFKQLVKQKSDNKIIIVIDEFQYIGISNPAFPSIFQKIWDEILSKQNVMVIVCGSLIRMMYAQVLAYDSPLYGRRTSQIRLKQIEFEFYKDFLPKLNFEELVLFYSITGGVPKYIETVKGYADVYEAINGEILNKMSYLYAEPNFLLNQEVNEIGSYFSIIRGIALGNRKLDSICRTLGKKATDLSKPLSTLIDLDLIEREVPITEVKPEKSKKGLYKLKDNFISFWFQFVYVYLSNLERDEVDYVLAQIKKSFITNHVAFVYEDIKREYMWQLNAKDKWDFRFNKLGRYWNKNIEVDIVAIDSVSKNVIVGECKYSKNKKDVDVFYQLKEKAKHVLAEVDNGKIASYVIFSKAGFSEKLLDLAKDDESIVLIND